MSNYPHARAVLASRIVQLHGTQHRLAQLLGESRQLLLQRQKSAEKYANSHGWWCNLLIMEPTWLLEEMQVRPMPSRCWLPPLLSSTRTPTTSTAVLVVAPAR